MDAIESFLHSFRGKHALQIFLVAFIVVFIKIGLKYMTKMDVFKASAATDPAAKKAAHFECLRIGMDLALLGIVSLAAVLRVVLTTPGFSGDRLSALGNLQTPALLFQLLLLVFATLYTGMFDDKERTFKRGIFVPGVLGCVSVLISVGAFYFASRGM